MKQCTKCNKEFIPTSRHAKCPECRYYERKNLCECGNEKAFASKVCLICSGKLQQKELNGRWRGGKTTHKKGYVLIRNTDHPRSKANSGYVFEHILVMEDSLGRHLLPGENVHHINGIRDDNRIENLELWTKPQPAGIRVSDAVEWAKEVIRLYGGDAG